MDFDEAWMKNEEQFQGNNIYEDRKNQLNRQMAHRFTSSNKIVLGKDAYSGQNNYQIKLSNPNPDEKLKIFVGGDYEDRSFPQSNLKINLRSSDYYDPNQLSGKKYQEYIEEDENESIYDEFAEVKFQGWM
mmetsp:Transcript_25904/g.25163  ORF Transcript_25904/g.25163 Transcript_25904/m.25163 type:complete len:131 (+) Transcript_25904:860-1252(+)